MRYLKGTDILGSFGGASGAAQYVVVHLRDVAGVVKSQGGSAGALAFTAAPQTVTNKVYEGIKSELVSGFRDKGIDADVQVVSSPPAAGAPQSDLFRGMVFGAGATAVGWALWKYLIRGMIRR